MQTHHTTQGGEASSCPEDGKTVSSSSSTASATGGTEAMQLTVTSTRTQHTTPARVPRAPGLYAPDCAAERWRNRGLTRRERDADYACRGSRRERVAASRYPGRSERRVSGDSAGSASGGRQPGSREVLCINVLGTRRRYAASATSSWRTVKDASRALRGEATS